MKPITARIVGRQVDLAGILPAGVALGTSRFLMREKSGYRV